MAAVVIAAASVGFAAATAAIAVGLLPAAARAAVTLAGNALATLLVWDADGEGSPGAA